MSVQIISVTPTGCCKPEEFVEGQRRTKGLSRPLDHHEGWPKIQFSYIYRCETCGQRWIVTYTPGFRGERGSFSSKRDGKTSRRYRQRLMRDLMRQGTP